MLNAKLVVVGGDAKEKEVSLNLPTVIGRGKDVTLTLPHALVSRQHTEIFEKDGWLFVKDLGSLNGTYVNNRRIKEPQKLLPNHLLTLGNVTFRAVYEALAAEASAEAEKPTGKRKEDETVNLEDLLETKSDKSDKLPDSKDRPNPQPNPVLEKSTTNSVGDPGEAQQTPRLRRDAGGEPAPSSSIFSGDEEFITPDKSISISALEGLPSPVALDSVSFVGNQLKDIAGPEKQAVDSIELDVPESGPAAQSDVDLGSFLRKIPR